MRAIASEIAICSGIRTIEKLITNQTPSRKLGSVNALR